MSSNLLNGITPSIINGATKDGNDYIIPKYSSTTKDHKDGLVYNIQIPKQTGNRKLYVGFGHKAISASNIGVLSLIGYKDDGGHVNWASTNTGNTNTAWNWFSSYIVIPAGMTPYAFVIATVNGNGGMRITNVTLSYDAPVVLAMSDITATNVKDGKSPTVSVSKSGTVTTIVVTNADGSKTTQTVNDGVNGTPGAKGADGRTPYFHVKYSNDGGKTFTTNSGETIGTYIGTCTDYNSSDPTSVSSYTWARIKGDTGATGSQGVSVSKIVTYYKLQASSASAPASPASSTSDWSTTEPAFSAGSTNTLYTCEQSTYSNGAVVWGSVQKSSSYEAAKEAYNKSVTAQNTANSANNNANAIKNNIYVPNTTTINGGKIATGSIKAAQIDVNDLFAQTINATGTIKGARLISDKGRIAGWNIDTDAFWNKDEQSDNTHTAVLGNGTELNSIIFTDENGNPYTDGNGVEYSMDDGVVLAVESAGANGVNPDVPFYVRNDGYAYLKKVYISGESGSKIDADLIVGKIRADQLDAQGIKVNAADIIGRLGANQIDANNLTINAGNIRGKLTANQVDVNNIFAQNVNATGIINGGTIKGATITGATGSFTGSINATEITAKSSISVYGGSWSGTETAVQSVYMANTIFSQLFPNSMAVQIGLSAVDNPSGYNPAGGAGNVYVGNLYSGYVTCINGLNNYSSRVIKTNIVPESEESARRILDLDVVKFDYKPGVCPDSSRFDRRGLIAEDTLNVMPEIVYIPDEYKKNGYTGDNTKVPSIDYTKLIPDLVKMVQIQQKQLDRVPKNTAGTTTLYFADSDHVIIFSRSQADATAVVRVCNAEFRESDPIFIKDVVFSIESDSWLVYIDKKTTGYLKVNYTITVQEES